MKYLIGIFFSIVLYSNEIDVMDNILSDIENLRADYESCKNNASVNKIDSLNKENDISKFEKQLKDLENILKTKDISIKNLKNKINRLVKNKENNKNTLLIVEKEVIQCLDDNPFPLLMMKDSINEKEEKIAPTSFALKNDSYIYDAINGSEISKWKEKSLFTSNIMTENWMKITGYFVNDKWQKSKEELWIKKINIIKR